MKNLQLFLLVSVFSIATFSANASNTLKTVTVEKFTGIKVNGNYQVYLKQGNTQSVKIEGEEADIKEVSTKVTNNIWSIQNVAQNGKSSCSNNYYNNMVNQEPLKIYITVPTLTYISLTSRGKVMTENNFTVDNIDLKLNGSGKMRLNLKAQSIESNLCGSGKMVLKGDAKHLESRISGSGDVDAEDMEVENVHISVSGSGDAQVYATSYLKARVSGSGDVFYKGSPSVHKSVTGSGSVTKI